MNLEKIRQIEARIQKNRLKLQGEKDQKKKTILRMKMSIDDLRIKIEKLKD
jgi:hypothetical protein